MIKCKCGNEFEIGSMISCDNGILRCQYCFAKYKIIEIKPL